MSFLYLLNLYAVRQVVRQDFDHAPLGHFDAFLPLLLEFRVVAVHDNRLGLYTEFGREFVLGHCSVQSIPVALHLIKFVGLL